MSLISLLAAIALGAVHVFAGRLTALEGRPRNVWLSAAGGMTVAYVFLFLLPHLAHGQRVIDRSGMVVSFLEHHAYVLALAGLVVFYGLERAVKSVTRASGDANPSDHQKVFWAHMASFSCYNFLIGCLLVQESKSISGLTLFFVAMALHFVVIDFGFREHYRQVYHNVGRWVLAFAVVAGWIGATVVAIPQLALSLLIAFLSGGIILNVLKEEIPEERQSRFIPFLCGALFYAALLLGQA